jgi:hypothetical protein
MIGCGRNFYGLLLEDIQILGYFRGKFVLKNKVLVFESVIEGVFISLDNAKQKWIHYSIPPLPDMQLGDIFLAHSNSCNTHSNIP